MKLEVFDWKEDYADVPVGVQEDGVIMYAYVHRNRLK